MLAILFALMVVLLILAVPVGVVLLCISLFPAVMDPTVPANFAFVIRQMIGGLESTPLLAVPMFVLSGVVMARGGVSKKIFDVFAYFLGNVTAGMPCAVVVTCLFYGAISGSAPATTAAVGTMTIPILVSMGYDITFVASLVAISGGLGVIIPPSIPIIMYCMSSGESVGSMFIAGVLPGLMIGGLLMVYAFVYCKLRGEDKVKIREQVSEIKKGGFGKLFMNSFWALMSPVIILGGIYSGIVTPTEAAVLSVVYSLIISLFVYRTLDLKSLVPVFVEAVKTYAPVVFIVSAASGFGRVLAILQAPQMVAAWVGSLGLNKITLLLMVNLLLLFVGMIMDTGPAILILTPILLPIVQAVGVNPMHFGILMVVNLAIGFVTPPVGVNLYVASTLTKIPPMSIAKKAMPAIGVFFLALLLITFVPGISLLLVS
ncbi:MAG: TRAP transporter large permease [Lachnospiraceae bacterium]|nr:TRAP transporter large permease [Lachnospiraceae bacterium]MDO5550405.1 TRAP transporter large permease [Lachnospiraceae bacterium]